MHTAAIRVIQMLKCYSVKVPFLWEYVVFEQGIDDEGKHSHLFCAKARGKIFQKRI